MRSRAVLTLFFLCVFIPVIRAQLTWTKLPTPSLISTFAIGLDGSLYIIGQDFTSQHVIFLSDDGGGHWSKIGYGDALACDSNGAVIIRNNGVRLYSTNHGNTWDSIGPVSDYQGYLQATNSAIYLAEGSSEIHRTTDYGAHWVRGDTLRVNSPLDCAGMWCGSDDRVLATLHFESSWQIFDSTRLINDTAVHAGCAMADNSPPRFVFLASDHYVYMNHFCGLVRLPKNSLRWERYGDSLSYQDSTHKMPSGSPSANTLIAADSNSTYSSTDHGDSWQRIGEGVPYDYSMQMAFDRNGNGYALTNGSLYATRYFASVEEHPGVANSILRIHPNPTTSTIEIESDGVERIEVRDILGNTRMIRDFEGRLDNPSVDVSSLSAGVYSVIVTSGSGRSMARFVKK